MNKFYKSEFGRSLVEMLGTLAMIGVLTIVGMFGYQVAMNRYRANELLNEVGKRAAVVAAQLSFGREDVDLSEFGNALVGGAQLTAELFYEDDERTKVVKDEFYINVSEMSQPVCDIILKSISDNTSIRFLVDEDGKEMKDCNGNLKNVGFVYNSDFNSGVTKYVSCDSGFFLEDGKCYSCPTEGVKSCDNKGLICDDNEFYYKKGQICRTPLQDFRDIFLAAPEGKTTDLSDAYYQMITKFNSMCPPGKYAVYSEPTGSFDELKVSCTTDTTEEIMLEGTDYFYPKGGKAVYWPNAQSWCQAHNGRLTYKDSELLANSNELYNKVKNIGGGTQIFWTYTAFREYWNAVAGQATRKDSDNMNNTFNTVCRKN